MNRAALILVASVLGGSLGTGCTVDEEAGVPRDPASRLPGGDTTNTLLFGSNAFLRPSDNISVENEMAFFTGNSFFNQGWVTAPSSTQTRDGLGPLFNARSCASCHFKDGRGSGPLDDDLPDDFNGLLLRISDAETGAAHSVYGDQIQPHGIEGVPGEAVQEVTYRSISGTYGDGSPWELLEPTYRLSGWAYGDPGELEVSPRVAPQMIGLGLLEAVPLERLEALADAEDSDSDGISGRISWIEAEGGDAPGRFGWKAEQPSLRAQNGAAFLGDIGITSQRHPDQNCSAGQVECLAAIEGGEFEIEPHLFDRVEVYTAMLAPPARRGWDQESVRRGEGLFAELGCAGCHTPRHVTGEHAFAELSGQVIFPYTDLLLHDMGEGLSDGRSATYRGAAQAQEWRTPPLWGIGLLHDVNGHQRLLHDGRARGVAEAILWHGGEAEEARDRFVALSEDDRNDLIEFINSL